MTASLNTLKAQYHLARAIAEHPLASNRTVIDALTRANTLRHAIDAIEQGD